MLKTSQGRKRKKCLLLRLARKRNSEYCYRSKWKIIILPIFSDFKRFLYDKLSGTCFKAGMMNFSELFFGYDYSCDYFTQNLLIIQILKISEDLALQRNLYSTTTGAMKDLKVIPSLKVKSMEWLSSACSDCFLYWFGRTGKNVTAQEVNDMFKNMKLVQWRILGTTNDEVVSVILER